MDIQKYKNMGMTPWQLEVIKAAYKANVSQEMIDTYLANTRFDHLQMEKIKDGLTAGIDVSIYAKPEIDYESMDHILHQELEKRKKEIAAESSNEKIFIQEKRLKNIKTALIIVVSIGAAIMAILAFKDYFLGYFQNLNLVLKAESINIPVNEPFNAKDYIEDYTDDDNVQISIPNLNTDKLGTYYVDYIVYSPYKTLKKQLEVNIVDEIAPELALIQEQITLTRDVDDFECRDYIDSYSDNYDDDIRIVCNSDIDWSQDKQTVEYIAQDNSGNQVKKELLVNIIDKPIPIAPIINDKPSYGNEQESNHSSDNNWEGSGQVNQPVPEEPPQSNEPFLNGVHNVSISVDSSINDLIYQLTSGLSASGNISVDYSQVNLSCPGTYTVYLYTSDGINQSCSVTVS